MWLQSLSLKRPCNLHLSLLEHSKFGSPARMLNDQRPQGETASQPPRPQAVGEITSDFPASVKQPGDLHKQRPAEEPPSCAQSTETIMRTNKLFYGCKFWVVLTKYTTKIRNYKLKQERITYSNTKQETSILRVLFSGSRKYKI